jgi:hypothetical protein
MAGVFDAVGSLSITTHNSVKLKIRCTDKRLLDPFLDYKSNKIHFDWVKRFWFWEITGRDCIKLLKEIRPFLRAKSDLADEFIRVFG